MPASIEFRDVSLATRESRRILNGISFAVEEGTVTAILGRSGSGKTTLLRTVNRIIEPTGGDVLVQANSSARRRPHRTAPRHRLCDPGDRPLPAFHRRAQRWPGA